MSGADDPRLDGAYQRMLGSALGGVLKGLDLPAGMLIVVTTFGRVMPVYAFPEDLDRACDPLELAAELLRTALAQIEAGRVSHKPKDMP